MLVKLFKKVLSFCWLLPGFLLWASFPPMGELADCFFALAPLMYLSRKGDVKRNCRLWFVNGFIFWFATLSWMPAIVKNNGPWPLVVLGWLALAAYCALYFLAFGWLSTLYWRWANGNEKLKMKNEKLRNSAFSRFSPLLLHFLGFLLVEPVLWCGLELVRSRFLGGFSWNQLGVAPINAGFGSPAAVGGVYLVSATVVLVNGTIAGIADRFITRDRRWYRTLETILAFALVWGIYSIPGRKTPESLSYGSVKFAMVQRNFPCCFKGQEQNPYLVYSNLVSRVESLSPDIVVLPESAMCEFGTVDSPRAIGFAKWISRQTGRVLAGGSRYNDGRIYNSAALYDGNGFQVYDKVHLVPFGEFIPGDKLFPWLQRFAPVGSCTPGEEELLHTFDQPFGVAICFEDTDSALMRRYAAAGAKFLCFITNDSWFSQSNEAVAHAWQATARAIETGLPVIRVGNSGVTGTITSDGKTNWLCGSDGRPLVDAQGVMFDRMAINNRPAAPTPYVIFGDVPLGSAFALLILGYILVYLKNIYEKRRIVSLQIG